MVEKKKKEKKKEKRKEKKDSSFARLCVCKLFYCWSIIENRNPKSINRMGFCL